MKVKDIIEKLILWTPTDNSCDTDKLLFGREDSDVDKVGVCCVATCEVIKAASSWGARMLVTHEGVLHFGPENAPDRVANNKRKLIEEMGMAIYRFHDHMHSTQSDKIIEGVIKKLGWQGTFDGRNKFTFDTKKDVEDIKKDIETNLGLKNVRICGNKRGDVKNISMCVGAWGNKFVMNELEKPEIDAVICGEITEYIVCEYVRDKAELGDKTTLFLLGHMGSEKSGMEYLCECISKEITDVEFKYFDCGEVY